MQQQENLEEGQEQLLLMHGTYGKKDIKEKPQSVGSINNNFEIIKFI